MKLGFVTAILPDLGFDEVLEFTAKSGYECIEVMCWPPGKAERRYAGVTHIDVTSLNDSEVSRIKEKQASTGVSISGLGYYPNALVAEREEAGVYIDHIKKVIQAAGKLGIPVMNTFIGRDWTKSVEDNWPRFKEVWKPIIGFAEDQGVKVAIENCPMYFSNDEWPSGKNLAHSPEIWRRMFEDIPSESFGLNFDPSHLVWQHIDYCRAVREFRDKIFHAHAKDARIDTHNLDEVGILATPLKYHTPKLPGLGDVNWGKFISELTEVGYDGPLCVEVEDRAYEGSLDNRKAALRQSVTYLRQFV